MSLSWLQRGRWGFFLYQTGRCYPVSGWAVPCITYCTCTSGRWYWVLRAARGLWGVPWKQPVPPGTYLCNPDKRSVIRQEALRILDRTFYARLTYEPSGNAYNNACTSWKIPLFSKKYCNTLVKFWQFLPEKSIVFPFFHRQNANFWKLQGILELEGKKCYNITDIVYKGK